MLRDQFGVAALILLIALRLRCRVAARKNSGWCIVYTALDRGIFQADFRGVYRRRPASQFERSTTPSRPKRLDSTRGDYWRTSSGRVAICFGTMRFSIRFGWSGPGCCGRTSRRRPPPFRPKTVRPQGLWYGFAARARVLMVNTNQLPEERRPKSIHDLTDPQWYDRCGIAKPLFGTTATQAACLFAAWGDDKAKDFFRDVKHNAADHVG